MATLYIEDGYVDDGYTQTGVTVIWGQKIIFVPKIAMIQIQSTPTEIWQLDIPTFKATLGDLLDDTDGMSYPDIFNHNPSVTVGGAVLAKVVEILEPYTITFEDGQYAVNLTGANSNIGDRVNVNQVSVRSANSAGLQDLTSLQAASFGNVVAIDVINGVSGTTFPIGTKGKPVNNMIDAVKIAQQQNINTLFIIGNITLDVGDNVDNYIIQGENPTKSLITINDLASTVGCEIKLATVTGILDGGSVLRECLVYNINYVNGFLVDCVLGAGTIVLGGGATALFMRCVSGVPGLATPIIDMGGSGQSLGLRNYNGGMTIKNKTGSDPFSLDINSGRVYLEDTVTNGVLVCRGVGKLIDNSTGTATVINEMLNGAEVSNVQRLIELGRSSHGALGRIWYWSPYSGDDTNEGDHVSRPVRTFAKAQELAKDYGHDMVIGIADDPSGVTYADEAIVFTKNYLSLRSTGNGFVIKPVTVPDDPIHISTVGTAISNVRVETDGITAGLNGVHIINASDFRLDNVWVSNCTGDGIYIENSSYGHVHEGYMQSIDGHGLNVRNAAHHIWFNMEGIHGAGGDGVHIEGNTGYGGTGEIKLEGALDIHYCGGYGINVVSGGSMTRISKDIVLVNNALGAINDPNGNTFYEGAVPTAELVADIAGSGLTAEQDALLSRTAYIEARVYVDTEALTNGDGSQLSPFNIFNDAKDFAETNGIYVLVVHGEVTIPSNFRNFTVLGVGVPVINTNGQDLRNSKFFQCEMRGTYTGVITVQESVLYTGFELNGFFEKCMLAGDLACTTDAVVVVANCFSGIAGLGRPTISMNSGAPTKLSVRSYSGGLTITDADHIDDEVTVEISQGALLFDATCVAGSMVARGVCNFTDNSAGATVLDKTLSIDSLTAGIATKKDVINAAML